VIRQGERQLKPGFQVGLVEAGKNGPGAVGHKQSIQVIVVTIQRQITRRERDVDAVRTRLKRCRFYEEMFAFKNNRQGDTVNRNSLYMSSFLLKID
jgi:hypothetical protein